MGARLDAFTGGQGGDVTVARKSKQLDEAVRPAVIASDGAEALGSSKPAVIQFVLPVL
jgi:hypothetical protein